MKMQSNRKAFIRDGNLQGIQLGFSFSLATTCSQVLGMVHLSTHPAEFQGFIENGLQNKIVLFNSGNT